jgi:hypothetical protein
MGKERSVAIKETMEKTESSDPRHLPTRDQVSFEVPSNQI